MIQPNAIDPVTQPEGFLRAALDAAIAAVQPDICVPPALPAPGKGRTLVLGGGKAAAAMAAAVERHWPGPLSGLVVTREGYGCPTQHIEVIEASHPVPDARGAAAAERILALAATAAPEDLVLCLISGGASALLAAPAPGVTLAEKRAITSALLKSGATIQELNCVRKHLSRLKGGRLAAATRGRIVTLIISDVVGDDPAVIASGPTVPDPTTCADALAVLTRYRVPFSDIVRAGLAGGAFESPKSLASSEVRMIATPRDALDAGIAFARNAGLAVLDLGDAIEGEARKVAADHARLIDRIRRGEADVAAPCLIVSGGELTVTVGGEGAGGPNTEYALALAAQDRGVWAIAADTDGTDGNAGAAGGLIRPDTLTRAAQAGLDPVACLGRNDSAGFFRALNDLVDTGPTLTNVNDFRASLVLP